MNVTYQLTSGTSSPADIVKINGDDSLNEEKTVGGEGWYQVTVRENVYHCLEHVESGYLQAGAPHHLRLLPSACAVAAMAGWMLEMNL